MPCVLSRPISAPVIAAVVELTNRPVKIEQKGTWAIDSSLKIPRTKIKAIREEERTYSSNSFIFLFSVEDSRIKEPTAMNVNVEKEIVNAKFSIKHLLCLKLTYTQKLSIKK
jgi:transcription elongation factor